MRSRKFEEARDPSLGRVGEAQMLFDLFPRFY